MKFNVILLKFLCIIQKINSLLDNVTLNFTVKLLLSWLDLWRRDLILPYPDIQHYSWKLVVIIR